MPPQSLTHPQGVDVTSVPAPEHAEVLTAEALAFVAELHRRFDARRRELLDARIARQVRLDAGERPDFLAETADVRAGEWQVAPVPQDLRQRHVEITGPVDRKMIINALNSGADVFMADFEDANSPTWGNCLDGQFNLRDAIRRQVDFTHPTTGKSYALNPEVATLVVRPRGLHLLERHVTIDGEPCSGSLFDFGLYLFHNAAELLRRGSGPYFYLPKLESHLEARWWNDVISFAQESLGLPIGTVKATVLIETITAAFEMDEILYELRDHSSGLNCGRWDYIFSFIKRFGNHPEFVMPDRGLVGMDRHFLRSYSQLLIQTCHRRGAHAMGGMAAQIPIKNDAERNAAALAKVHADKQREANDGHDGTWVAHPGLVSIAREELNKVMTDWNQFDVKREDVKVNAEDLLAVPEGPRTEAGLRQNINVGVLYVEAWLSGSGCVPLYDLMEDAATAEISRTQVWQWLRHGATLDDGRTVDAALVEQVIDQELGAIRQAVGDERWNAGRYTLAGRLFREMCLAETCPEFLTLAAYEHLD
ncbi:MAG: malate synthase A [Planctomycetota bacterium]|jgi:malate synthase